MSIQLVKCKMVNPEQDVDKSLISGDGEIKYQPAGVLIKFKGKNKRHPDHYVLIEKREMEKFIDDYMDFLFIKNKVSN